MHIDKFKGEDFQGVLRFYPTSKNPVIAKGSYKIYGQYDKESKRILINPGKWLEHPNGYYKTIIVGSFDPEARSFSGFFQGIMGCTSFEAKADVKSAEIPARKIASKHRKTKKKKTPAAAPQPQVIKNLTPDEVIAPAAAGIPPVTGDINLGNPKPGTPPSAAPTPAPVGVPPALQQGTTAGPLSVVTPSPASPAPLAVVPSSSSPPAVSPLPLIPATPASPSSQVMPDAPPPPSAVPSSPSATPASKPSSSLAPKAGPHVIMLAQNWPSSPDAQQLPADAASMPQEAPMIPAPDAAGITQYPADASETPQAPQAYDINAQQIPGAQPYDTSVEQQVAPPSCL